MESTIPELPDRESREPVHWQCRSRTLDLTRRGVIMGILNVTPDSFSDGGRWSDPDKAVKHALRMVSEGAEIIDIGGESTRPGAREVPAAEELRRVLPVVSALRARTEALLSIDTTKSAVARSCMEAGADIINDVSGLRFDPDMARTAAATGAGLVLMHMQGVPRTMQQQPQYHDAVAEVCAFLDQGMEAALAAGVPAQAIALDPGIGFGKATEHNLAILRRLDAFGLCGRPVLLGVSQKSFISAVTGAKSITARRWPTVALTAFARERGVRIFRVHDVRPNVHVLRLTEAILDG